MTNLKQAIFRSRVNTVIGSLFVGSWTLGCSLLLWQASFDQNPIGDVFAKVMYGEVKADF